MSEERKFSTYLAKVNDTYMPMIERQMSDNSITFSDYSKRCVMNAIGSINQMLDKNGVNFNSPDLDQSNLTSILLNVAHLELNSIAQPSECYFQIRNVKVDDGKYKKQIEFGIQADGYDAILSRFGRDIAKVYPFWLVREDDFFAYPKYNGLEFTPPQWEPKGTGKVVRIVYPVLHKDNTIHFYIGERADVLNNLLAHINNNMMNETFGIAKNRYNATPEQLNKINEKKNYLKNKAKSEGFGALDDEELAPYISPSWKEDFSREAMIIRKMRNNIVKKIPKDFGSPAVYESFSEASDDGYLNTKRIIEEKTAAIEVDPIEPPLLKSSVGNGEDYNEVELDIASEEKSPNEPPEAKCGESVDQRKKPKFN